MGVDIYHLQPRTRRRIRIGEATYDVGVISRLWKVTETDLLPDRLDAIDFLEDAQMARDVATPVVVMVDGYCEFGERGEIRAFRLLGWDKGRLKTQDYDWDHLPTIGWAVDTGTGDLVVHEAVEDRLVPMSGERATALGVVGSDGMLAEHRLPTITECYSVASLGDGFYAADCVFGDGRRQGVSGESESGELPSAEWFVGRDSAAAARFSLAEQVALKPK